MVVVGVVVRLGSHSSAKHLCVCGLTAVSSVLVNLADMRRRRLVEKVGGGG